MNRIIILGYILLSVSFVIFSYFFIDKNFLYLNNLYTGISYDNKILVSVIFAAFIICFFKFYFYFLKNLTQGSIHKIIRYTVLASCILLFSYPAILSYDIFNYYATSKVTFFYRENPYLVMPNEFLNDPMLLFTRAANKYALYGFSWIILTGIPYFLSFKNVLVELFLLKVLAGVFYAGTGFLIYKLKKSTYALTYFLLNPLVLIETFVSGHNDAAMIFFSLTSFYFIKKKKFAISLLFLFISVFIKYATILLLPLWIFILVRRLKSKEIIWDNIWWYASLLMFFVFLISPVREEMYPWYAIWFLPFIALVEGKKLIKQLCILLTLGLLLSYIPYMATWSYFGYTPLLKYFSVVFPIGLYLCWKSLRKIFKKT